MRSGLQPTRGARFRKAGGAGRDRTGDLLNANQALSQLSYSPFYPSVPDEPTRLRNEPKLVGLGRVELPTSPLSGVRSNQLSYRPETRKGEIRIEADWTQSPMTSTSDQKQHRV
jgi:hypothetical protein